MADYDLNSVRFKNLDEQEIGIIERERVAGKQFSLHGLHFLVNWRYLGSCILM